MKKFVFLVLCGLLFLSLTGCGGPIYHITNGKGFYSEGNYKEAIKEYEEALRSNPHPDWKWAILNDMGMSYYRLGEFETASRYLHQCIGRGTCNYNLAFIYYASGNVKDAYKYSLKANSLLSNLEIEGAKQLNINLRDYVGSMESIPSLVEIP